MKEKLRRFMTGRYGVDSLTRFMMGVTIVCLIAGVFVEKRFLIDALAMTMIILSYVRMFSKNYQRRYQENMIYLRYKNKLVGVVNREKSYMEQRKTHHIYKCPTCKQKIRIPKGKGKVCVTCPKCRTEFVKNSR